MYNTFINVVLIIIYIVIVVLASLHLSRYSFEIQCIAIVIVMVVAIALDRLLLHYFREFFEKQWYYSTSYNWKTEFGDNIVKPFLFIGAIVYSIVQAIIFKCKVNKKNSDN